MSKTKIIVLLLLYTTLNSHAQNKYFVDAMTFSDAIATAKATRKPIFFIKQFYNQQSEQFQNKKRRPNYHDIMVEVAFNRYHLLDGCVNFGIDNDTLKLQQIPKEVLAYFNPSLPNQKSYFIIIDADLNLLYKPALTYESGEYIEFKELWDRPDFVTEALALKKSYKEFTYEFKTKNTDYTFLNTFLKKSYYLKNFTNTLKIQQKIIQTKQDLTTTDYLWFARNLSFSHNFKQVLSSKEFQHLYNFIKAADDTTKDFINIRPEESEMSEISYHYKQYFNRITALIYDKKDMNLKKLHDKYKDATPFTKRQEIIFNNYDPLPPPPKF